MQMLGYDEIAAADLGDWRKLGQGLHARFVTDGFGAGARFVSAVADVGESAGHHPEIRMADTYVDLKLISHDAVYSDDEGTEHQVSWVTQQDLDVARGNSKLAADLGLAARPDQTGSIELALDTANRAALAPVWSALLTGGSEAVGHGTIGDDVRDVTGRLPILWFQDTDTDEPSRQRFHLDVWVPHDVADQLISVAVDAGATIVDDSQAPAFVVLADPDGNKACVCTPLSPRQDDK
ncbi:MAG: 4a-hydroxytetrahydrobiopterin dehydratase [Actinomycetota bacterium]|nr:4a-hydroxytetrahydrobiopterin dehydratase [Actinomycetota bacterium]